MCYDNYLHGSAPDIAGTIGMILIGRLRRQYWNMAVEAVLDMKLRTADIKQEDDGCKLVGCVEMGQAVAYIVSTMIVKLMVEDERVEGGFQFNLYKQ